MALDKLTESEFKKFGVDPEILKEKKKSIPPAERWKIVNDFFNSKNYKFLCNAREKTFIFDFKNIKDARDFSDSPTLGLPAFTRQVLLQNGDDPKDYDVYFNLAVMHDPSGKKPNQVIVRVL